MQSVKKMKSKLTQQNTISASLVNIEFASTANSASFKKQVLSWLEADFKKQNHPKNHFWHNKDMIATAFDDNRALVALTHQEKCVGYMIWGFYENEIGADIQIVEVKEEYRKQGVLKNMINSFCQKFPDIAVLSGSIIPAAEVVFQHAGWRKIVGKHIKIIKPFLSPMHSLTNGPVIAVCASDFYTVKQNLEQYQAEMKYFKINLTEEKKLVVPLMIEHHHEGYVGVFFNKKLIAAGKAKHLFEREGFSYVGNLLVLNKIIPSNPALFVEFLIESQRKLLERPSNAQQLFSIETLEFDPATDTLQSEPESSKKRQADPLLFSSSFSKTPKTEETVKPSRNAPEKF